MPSERSRSGPRTTRLAALALAALAWPARHARAAAPEAEALVAGWPAPSRLIAGALIEKYGAPRKAGPDSLTWYGPGAWKRTVVRRSPGEGGVLEQTVAYRASPKEAALIQDFDGGIAVDRAARELTVRSDGEGTNYLLANLANEVASGFKTVAQARRFYGRQRELSAAGKSSSYTDRLRFAPSPMTSAPGTQPSGGPWNSRWPWVYPPGSNLPATQP